MHSAYCTYIDRVCYTYKCGVFALINWRTVFEDKNGVTIGLDNNFFFKYFGTCILILFLNNRKYLFYI
jgi:hypothetical protein